VTPALHKRRRLFLKGLEKPLNERLEQAIDNLRSGERLGGNPDTDLLGPLPDEPGKRPGARACWRVLQPWERRRNVAS